MTLYELSHTYYYFDGKITSSVRLLGYFSKKDLATHAISEYLKAPGYCDAPLAFTIQQRKITGTSKQKKVYLAVIYAHDREYESFEHVIEIGLFFNKDDAMVEITKFRKENERFYKTDSIEIEEIVDTYEIDKKYCEEGFVVLPD